MPQTAQSQYNFSEYDIQRYFNEFIYAIGVKPLKTIDFIFDGEIHRFEVEGDKSGEKSGSYALHNDHWPAGFVQDWRQGIKEKWSFPKDKLDDAGKMYFNEGNNYKKAIERSKKRSAGLEKKRIQDQHDASIRAENKYNTFSACPSDFPYLVKKNIRGMLEGDTGFKYDKETNKMIVPFTNIKWEFQTYQSIDPDGNKKFSAGAPKKGNFWSYNTHFLADNSTGEGVTALLGEGIATMATVAFVTGLTVFAAGDCGNLKPVAETIKKEYPKMKIIITADNDRQRETEGKGNPGIDKANEVVKAGLALDYIAPSVLPEEAEKISDWNDYFNAHGLAKTENSLSSKIEEISHRAEDKPQDGDVLSLLHPFDVNKKVKRTEFIGGIFPRGYLTVLAGSAGVGKSNLILRFMADLSNGGTILTGLAENEPKRKILAFIGELGEDGMIQRAQDADYKINKEMCISVSGTEADENDINLLINSTTGQENIKKAIEQVKPDIVFIDSLIAFFDGDEKDNKTLAPAIKFLKGLASSHDCAIVVAHHNRKRLSNEQSKPLVLDDLIGGNVIARLAGLVIACEREQALDGAVRVSCLKSWFKYFKEFSFTVKTGFYGKTDMLINLDVPSRSEITLQNKDEKTAKTYETYERVMLFLKGRGANGATLSEVSETLKMGMNTVKTQIKRLYDDEVITKLERGVYAFNESVGGETDDTGKGEGVIQKEGQGQNLTQEHQKANEEQKKQEIIEVEPSPKTISLAHSDMAVKTEVKQSTAKKDTHVMNTPIEAYEGTQIGIPF